VTKIFVIYTGRLSFFIFLEVGYLTTMSVFRLHNVDYRMINDHGAADAMRIGKGNRRTRREPTSVPNCSSQIPSSLSWAQTRSAAVGNQQLTA
jgi:hypothetical protein